MPPTYAKKTCAEKDESKTDEPENQQRRL